MRNPRRTAVARILTEQDDGVEAEKEIQKAQQLGLDGARIDAALAKALLASGQFKRLLVELKPTEGQNGEAWAEVQAARGTALLALHWRRERDSNPR